MSGAGSRATRQSAAQDKPQVEDVPVEWIDGVPFIPDTEADAALDDAAQRWPELMQRLAE